MTDERFKKMFAYGGNKQNKPDEKSRLAVLVFGVVVGF